MVYRSLGASDVSMTTPSGPQHPRCGDRERQKKGWVGQCDSHVFQSPPASYYAFFQRGIDLSHLNISLSLSEAYFTQDSENANRLNCEASAHEGEELADVLDE